MRINGRAWSSWSRPSLAGCGKSPPWPFSTKANLKKATGLRGSQPPHPAADEFLHGPLGGAEELLIHTQGQSFASVQSGPEPALLAGRLHHGMGSSQRIWRSITGSSSGDAQKIVWSSCACTARWNTAPSLGVALLLIACFGHASASGQRRSLGRSTLARETDSSHRGRSTLRNHQFPIGCVL
jgi:hypothetical protein